MSFRSTLTSTATAEPAVSNEELLAAAARGDQFAWCQLVDRHEAHIRAVARSFRIGVAEADDVVQLTWLSLLRNLPAIRDADRLRGWLSVTASREALRVIRRRTARPELAASTESDAEILEPSAGPEAQVAAQESAEALWAVVDELPAQQRRLVRALFSENAFSYREIATTCEMPIGSIGPIRARALLRLRQKLEARGFGRSDF